MNPPYKHLNRTIHEGARLAIMSLLAGAPKLSVKEMKEALGLTDGNLGAHLKTLDDAGYIQQEREVGNGRPTTYITLTHNGKLAFATYLKMLEDVLGPARLAPLREDLPDLGLAPG